MYFCCVNEAKLIFFCILHPISQKTPQGEVLEWLKRHAWKACIRQKRIAGSNPALSAYLLSEHQNVGYIEIN